MLPGAPQALSVEGQNLAHKVMAGFPPAPEGVPNELQELCPACGVGVPLTDIAVATCSNGHRWCESFMTSERVLCFADASSVLPSDPFLHQPAALLHRSFSRPRW
jgi:hypothetical protein